MTPYQYKKARVKERRIKRIESIKETQRKIKEGNYKGGFQIISNPYNKIQRHYIIGENDYKEVKDFKIERI